MNGYYELKNTSAGKHMFNLKAGNHEVILTSQSYESKDSALNGIASVRTHGQDDVNFERKQAANDEAYFVLKAANGQVIGTSETYSSAQARDNGIASVQQNAGSKNIKEA